MRNIQSFGARTDVQSALDNSELGKPYVALVDGYGLDWNGLDKTPPISAQPLTFEIISGGTIVWKAWGNTILKPAPVKTIEYSINGGEWTQITSSSAGTSYFNVVAGDKVQFRGNNNKYTAGGVWYSASYCFFTGTASYKIYGNIGSLINSTGFTSLNTLQEGCLARLFFENTNLLEVSNLSVGNNNLTDNVGAYAFAEMFNNCSILNYVKLMLENKLENSYFSNWLTGTAETGTLVLEPGVQYGSNIVPNGWTVVDA